MNTPYIMFACFSFTFRTLGCTAALVVVIVSTARSTGEVADTPVSVPSNAKLQALIRQLDDGDRYQACRALGELGTPGAQAALLEVALGKKGAAQHKWAARCYVRSLSNKRAARRLLEAPNPEVVAIGLLALAKDQAPIDGDLFADLKPLLRSNKGYVRQCCARLIRASPLQVSGREVAREVIASLGSVSTVDHADEPWSFANDLWAEYTVAGMTYRDLIRALACAKAITLQHLTELTPRTPGVVRDCVLIARAWRDDSSVRLELYRIARKVEHPNLRGAALYAFSWIGTVEDLPFLQTVAATDPYRVKLSEDEKHVLQVYLPAGAAVPNYVYPNRSQAENVIRRIKGEAHQKN